MVDANAKPMSQLGPSRVLWLAVWWGLFAPGMALAGELQSSALGLGRRAPDLDAVDDQGGLLHAERCRVCATTGTLFQWSRGTQSGGGPNLAEPLVTDRPDFTEASVTVGAGVTQFELGYSYFNDRAPGAAFDGHVFPELLLRQGMFADWFEMRVGWTWLSDAEIVGNRKTTRSRSSDLLVGAKIALTPQQGILPEMAIVTQMFLPISDEPILGGGEVLPGLNWLYSWDLGERLSTAGSSQLLKALDGATGDPFGLFAQSWTLGYSVRDGFGTYLEWFAIIPTGAESETTQHYLNGGFTYLISDNLQLDFRVGVGLSDAADDYFLGPGISVRIP